MLVLAGALVLAVAPVDSSVLQRIQSRIAQDSDAAVGLAYIDLGSGDTLFLDADSSFHAASTMKVPVMIELFRRAAAGSFGMHQGLLLVNQFASIVDGSPYALDQGSDSDSTLYHRIGERVPVDTLLRLMITRSSNFATNTLITLVGAQNVTRTMRSLGAAHIQVLRGVEDGKAFERGLNNTTTARDLAIILRAIEEGKAASSAATREMVSILLAQEFNERIPAGLPPGVKVAHKTGDITAVAHDAAIVYPPNRSPYVLVVLTKGITDQRKSDKLISDLSRIVYEYNSGLGSSTAGRISR